MKRLIIIRGNSGSGKTTVAKMVQDKLERTAMLLSQDTLRREILRVREDSKHPTPELMQTMVRFGWSNGFDTVIVEGIWGAEKNGWALREMIDEADCAVVCYFDISFDETLTRHRQKPNAHEFGEVEMRRWWKEKDLLGTNNEIIITEELSKDDAVALILDSVI